MAGCERPIGDWVLNIIYYAGGVVVVVVVWGVEHNREVKF